MNWKNTKNNYGFIAKSLHWFMAFLFLAAYASVYYRQWFSEEHTPENWTALQLHLSFGVSIGVFVILRIIWRIMNVQPNEEPGTRLEHKLARFGHFLLYVIMIIAPLTGYLGTGVNTEYFFAIDIPKFSETWLFTEVIQPFSGLDFITFEKPIDFIHKKILGEWLIWMLILGHVMAALYHHFVKKDRTLKKMTTDKP